MTSVAYLVSGYPHLSHAFIEREVRAMRELGVEVSTFSVNPVHAEGLLSGRDREAHETTTVILGPGKASRATKAHVRCLLRWPVAYFLALRRALATGVRSPRSRLWQLFYFAEAVILHDLLARGDCRHIHTHFANNSADIARLTVHLGTAAGTGQWTWSLGMHGPTEFADVRGTDLAAKVRDAHFVACISDYCRSQLTALVEPEVWPRLHVVRMTVDVEDYPFKARRERTGDHPLRVLFVGRLVAEKGPDLLIDAVAESQAGRFDVRIVGNGPLREHLANKVRRLGRDVTLVGPLGQDDLPAEYALADAFCLPSAAEGLPVVLMEAMASGVPVVTTRITGIPELVEDGVTGLLVTPGRADLIAEALGRLAGDLGLAHALAEEGRRAVERDHTPARQSELLAKLFAEAAAGPR